MNPVHIDVRIGDNEKIEAAIKAPPGQSLRLVSTPTWSLKTRANQPVVTDQLVDQKVIGPARVVSGSVNFVPGATALNLVPGTYFLSITINAVGSDGQPRGRVTPFYVHVLPPET